MAQPVGRPTLMTPEVINKLEAIFAIGGTDREACFYAEISSQTLYNYQLEHPEFVERKEALKERPIIKARQTIVKALDDPDYAWKYVERKLKNEFAPRTEITGSDGQPLQLTVIAYKDNDTLQLPATDVPVGLPQGPAEVQDSSLPPASGQIEDAPKPADTEVTA